MKWIYAQHTLEVDIERNAVGVMREHLTATGLKPNYRYVLTINGIPGHPSNELLKEHCQTYRNEGYCDFDKVRTDAWGNMDIDVEEKLPRGKYKVKFLIKDPKNWAVMISSGLKSNSIPFTKSAQRSSQKKNFEKVEEIKEWLLGHI